MAELSVSTVQDEKDLLTFITFPWEVYRRDPFWVPPLLSERREFLDPKRNPFFHHAAASYFLARRKGRVVGTIAAFTNRLYNEFQGVNTGFFGFFEVLADQEAAEALLAAAEAWCREAGHSSILGPAQFSTNDEVGLLVEGFTDSPRILMTYNPPSYPQYLENAGYSKAMDLLAYRLGIRDFEKNIPEKLVRVAEKVAKRGKLRVRRIDMSRFDEEVGHVKKIYNKSWEKNWGFVPMTDPEFDRLARNLKSLIDPDLIVAVEAGDEVVGFGLSLPDLCQPLRLAYPRPGVPEALTLVQLMWHWKVRRRVDWLRILALGVLPEYQGMGVDALMYLETARSAFPKGYKMAELSWILETNEKMNRPVAALGGEMYKRYRMYEKAL